jgi:alpha-L-arabinofuranosidase
VNVLQAVLMTDGPEGKNCVRTTSYYAFMMFKPHRGATALKVEYDGMRAGMDNGRGGRGGAQDPSPELSVSASKQGNQMLVTLVNPRHDLTMDVDWPSAMPPQKVAARPSFTMPISTHTIASIIRIASLSDRMRLR